MAVATINVTDSTLANGGAAGDGSTDDTAAIQDAINRVPNNGGIVFFPAGEYRITGTLTMPEATSTILRETWLVGEGCGSDGNAGGVAGGASTILYDGPGGNAALDAKRTPANGLQPVWRGGLRDISLHDVSGNSGTIGLLTNSMRGGGFWNVAVRSFDGANWQCDGELFYVIFWRFQSYRGKCVHNEKINGSTFYACQWAEYGGTTDAAFQLDRSFAGSGPVFNGCWFERNHQSAVFIRGATTAKFTDCYFEGNGESTPRADIDWQPLQSNNSNLEIRGSYHRLTSQGHNIVRFDNSSSSTRATIIIDGMGIEADGGFNNVVHRAADGSSNTKLVATGVNIESGQTCPLWTGTLAQLDETHFACNRVAEPT